MSRKKANMGSRQVAHGLVELKDAKRELTLKLRRQKRTREQELEPILRQVARLQRLIEQIGLRHDAPIDATTLAIVEIDAKIAMLAGSSPANSRKAEASVQRLPARAVPGDSTVAAYSEIVQYSPA